MHSFYSLYNKIIEAGVEESIDEKILNKDFLSDFDPHHIYCLLNPERQPAVMRISSCDCKDEGRPCIVACLFDAISRDENGNISIDESRCAGCGECIENCKAGNLTDRKDLFPVFELLKGSDPVYAMIAPAFIGQFSDSVTPGKLRSAFKRLGFAGMLEVALFADILTLKEALEFDRSIVHDEDFQLTSCCCPIWIAMIRKIYSQLVPHVPASVSPMVACGRSIKKLVPNAKTVFIGPCVAKKAEAKEPDIRDAVDYVLSFQEIMDIFKFASLNPADLEEDMRDHSSTAGRIYARTGGVSEAVETTLNRLRPGRPIPFKAQQADGTIECKKLLNEIREGKISANFIEGMGCVSGCVGGPKAVLPKEDGTKQVNVYGVKTPYDTPADNPYVIELLHRLGFETVGSLTDGKNMFTRDF
ncbi:MAG: [Fe-Fe] hydrogenase large subunit C-terminal domain-containing protein [Bacillota bacterium]|nr:[Fe-Fe] hydrogenase large subunit C-terminal domain-containing protein [Bacillota bacterium]